MQIRGSHLGSKGELPIWHFQTSTRNIILAPKYPITLVCYPCCTIPSQKMTPDTISQICKLANLVYNALKIVAQCCHGSNKAKIYS